MDVLPRFLLKGGGKHSVEMEKEGGKSIDGIGLSQKGGVKNPI